MTNPDEPRGREFLEKARPEAMSHLLSFFKESGKHLEPKTRFLISVVTKVINYSPRGLRQYIRRAMEAGASKDEVLDAILCSYPCAGLTKVCDAATVYLDMGLGSDSPPAAPEGQWIHLDGAEKLAEGEMRRFTAGGAILAVARHQGKLVALGDTCPHRGGSLSEGEISGDALTCPLHGWNFRLADGAGAGIGHGSVPRYEVREAGGRAELKVPAR
jgi:nitrite reductase/ring-hydroxylating ferredoxin subunit/alkylhydroperoxidase/carboxymuconolactone decarboxylase family protein YurZ